MNVGGMSERIYGGLTCTRWRVAYGKQSTAMATESGDSVSATRLDSGRSVSPLPFPPYNPDGKVPLGTAEQKSKDDNM